jgi:hypothetical protein
VIWEGNYKSDILNIGPWAPFLEKISVFLENSPQNLLPTARKLFKSAQNGSSGAKTRKRNSRLVLHEG